MRRSLRLLGLAFVPTFPLFVIAACGARTGIFDSEPNGRPRPPQVDAAEDALFDAADASDASDDGALDATADAARDAGRDTAPLPDAPIPIPLCTDASAPLIYAVTLENTLLKFDPATSELSVIGTAACHDPSYSTPYSMAVDHNGVAYIEYSSAVGGANGIFRVSLTTGACTPLAFEGAEQGFDNFGMSFTADDGGTSETLYLASFAAGQLGAVDEQTLALSVVGSPQTILEEAELSGTGDGRLYAFTPNLGASGSTVSLVNRTSAVVTPEYSLATVTAGSGWAFAFWGGDFYIFTASSGAGASLTQFDPSTDTATVVATYPEVVVGAGASTCAPIR